MTDLPIGRERVRIDYTRHRARRPDHQDAVSPDLDLSRPPRSETLPAPSPDAVSPDLDLSRPPRPGAGPGGVASAGSAGPDRAGPPVSLDLGGAGPSNDGRSTASAPLPTAGHATASPAPASPTPGGAPLGSPVSGAATPAQPRLAFLRRRPPLRDTPDLRRTGNSALDFSADPLTGSAGTGQHSLPVPQLRGRTVLDAEHPKVVIGGEQASSGSLHLTLHWNTVPSDPRAAAAGVRPSTDVHLGCVWQFNDGTTGVLYVGGPDSVPGNDAASYAGNTVLRLGGRSEQDGQTLVASVRHLSHLRRMVLFVYAWHGHPQWQQLDPWMSVSLRGGATVELRPTPGQPWASTCALASVHRVGGSFVLRLESEYLNGRDHSGSAGVIAWAYGFTLPRRGAPAQQR
ncbi:MAG: hypothetical protein ACK5MT_21250 [Actinomycetales bacterium]